MKFIILLIFLFCSTAQAQLENLLNPHETEAFTAIDFFDPSEGFVVGSNGKLYKSIDSGKTFTKITIPRDGVISNIHISPLSVMFVIGDAGMILFSTDNGSSWIDISLNSFPNINLSCVGTLSPTTLFVGGENGFFAKSTDFGANWEVSSTGTTKVNKVVFLDHNRALALMDFGMASKTTDGGSTWHPFYIPLPGRNIKYFFDFSGKWTFLAHDFSYAFTYDQGLTYTSLISTNGREIAHAWKVSSSDFATLSRSGILSHPNYSTLYLSKRDYTGAWNSDSVTYLISSGPDFKRSTVYPFSFTSSFTPFTDVVPRSLLLNNSNDWVVSANTPEGDAGRAIRTTNAGLTWFLVHDNDWINSFSFLADGTSFKVRQKKMDISTDSGISWSNYLTFDNGVIISEKSFDRNNGFIILTDSLSKPRINSYSVIYKRSGTTPTYQLNRAGTRLTHLNFISPQNGWILQDSTRFYVTKNGGTLWTQLPVVTPFISAYERIGDSAGLLVTQKGYIMKTVNNAASWQTNFHDSSVVFQTVAVLGSNFIAAGDSGAFFISVDNGTTWLRKETNSKFNFSQVKFIGVSEFIITTRQGGIYKGDLSGSLVAIGNEAPDEFLPSAWLAGNYPNPFNSSTMIEFNTTEGGITGLTVYDVTGGVVHSEILTATKGKNTIRFDGNDLHSGVYLYVLEFGGKREYSKMILLK